MVFLRPQVGDDISAATFGQPVYDGIARMGGMWRRASNQAVGANAWANIIWDAEDSDTNGFLPVPNTTVTIPSGCDGLYSIYATSYIGSAGCIYAQVSSFSNVQVTGPTDPVTGAATVSFTTPLAAGATIWVRVYSTVAFNAIGRFEIWRTGI